MARITASAAERADALKTAVAGFLNPGDGYGYGSGSGDGSGDGSGYGSGYGSGSGSGRNCGVAAFCGDAVSDVDGVQTIIRNVHGNVAMGDILCNDLTLKKCYVVKGSGYFAHGETIRKAQRALMDKIIEDAPVEERIVRFIEEFKNGCKYPAHAFYEWHHRLTGSCEMGRNKFARDHGIDLENDAMTPEEFVELTKNAYGAEVIMQLKAAMFADER